MTRHPACHCGERLDVDYSEAEYDHKALRMSAPADCPDCGSSFTVSVPLDASLLEWDGADVSDYELSETGERAKRENAQANDWDPAK